MATEIVRRIPDVAEWLKAYSEVFQMRHYSLSDRQRYIRGGQISIGKG